MDEFWDKEGTGMASLEDIYSGLFPGFSADNIKVIVGRNRTRFLDRLLNFGYSMTNAEVDIALSDGFLAPGTRKFGKSGISFPGGGEFFISAGSDQPPFHDVDIPKRIARIGGTVSAHLTGMSPTLYATMQWEHRERLRWEGGDDWSITTLTLSGLRNADAALVYLDRALFKLGFSKIWEYTDWPQAGLSDWEVFSDGEQETFSIGSFDYAHEAPINFVNSSMRAATHEEKFILLYRVLEFYFAHAMSERLVSIRRSRLTKERYSKEVIKVANGKEIDSLKNLMGLIDSGAAVNAAHEGNLISHETSNALATFIYGKRNSIVHAKSDSSGSTALLPRYRDEATSVKEVEILLPLAMSCIKRWGRKAQRTRL